MQNLILLLTMFLALHSAKGVDFPAQKVLDAWQQERLVRLENTPKTYSHSAPVYRNVLYKQTNDWFGLLDIYMPVGDPPAPVPVVVYFHGGGWSSGIKESIIPAAWRSASMLETMTERGFAVVAVGYRLCNFDPENVIISDCVTDCKDAVRFLVKNAERYKLDTGRMFVWGGSAGGHLAQMVALTLPESFPGDSSLLPFSIRLAGGVSWFGPSDFVHYESFGLSSENGYHRRWRNRIFIEGASPEKILQTKKEISPVLYVTKESVPMMFAHGDIDRTISYKQMLLMQAQAEIISAPFQFLTVKNGGHGWKKETDREPIPPEADIIRQCADFIESIARCPENTTINGM